VGLEESQRINTPSQSIDSILVWLCVHYGRPHGLVVMNRVMFGVVVTVIGRSWRPEDVKLLLVHSVLDPIEAHADGLIITETLIELC
jgi:hypothetical protein